MNIYSYITIFEVLCINTVTTYLCSVRRLSKAVTLLLLCLVTVAVTAAMLPAGVFLPDWGKGNGLFMLFGFVYVLPLYFIFAQPMKHMLIILSSSWTYTMFTFSVSHRIGSLLPAKDSELSSLVILTLFFALTLPYYIKLVNNIIANILKKADQDSTYSLLIISLSWFFIIFLADYVFTSGGSSILELILLFIVIINGIVSYKLAYKLATANVKTKELTQITKIDRLTGLKNREGFYETVNQRIAADESFSVILADLDNFKSVNDTYGHAVGDKYLLEFVSAVKALPNKSVSMFRLHGDEFTFLLSTDDIQEYCADLEELRFSRNTGFMFKGISFGCASYPEDSGNLSDLLHQADLRMYQRKKEKHRLRVI